MRNQLKQSILWTAHALFLGVLLLCSQTSFAQTVEKEPRAILELGGAASFNTTERESTFGPTLAVEVAPIDKWLELELGVTPFITAHSVEWDTDLLFKKPWTLSRTVEFMAGIGPTWSHSTLNGHTSDSGGIAGALDFMFWPSGKQRLGWYVEPAYEYNFMTHERSIGVAGGLLIAIR